MSKSLATTIRATVDGLVVGGVLALSLGAAAHAGPYGKGGNYMLAPAKAESAPDAGCKVEAVQPSPLKAAASTPRATTTNDTVRATH